MMTVKKMIDLHMIASLEKGASGPFDPGAMGDTLILELEDSWHAMPDTTKAVMLGVAVELKRHYANGMWADIEAEHFVEQLKQQS